MKKVLKWIAISLATLLLILIIAISITIWFVFTPERLTPVVRKQAANYITCKSEIEKVELTFFSTFPKFGLKISNFALINPVSHAPSDTLVSTNELVGVIDLGAYWNHDEIVLNELIIKNGTINAFIDSLGRANFDITKPDTVPAPIDTSQAQEMFKVNINNIDLRNISLSYIDKQGKMYAGITNLSASISGTLEDDSLVSKVVMSNGIISFEYDGEKYLNTAAIKLDIHSKFDLSKELIDFKESEASINDITLNFKGTVENDTIYNRINTNIDYSTNKFPIPSIIALIPPSFQSYVEGMSLNGNASSDGKITGFYSDSVMPLMDLHVVLYDGKINIDGVPLPLSNTKGDFVFYSDLTNDDITYFRINKFSANTPKSSFSTSGLITRLFSDIYIDITSETDNLNLSEFAPFIPEGMNIKINGMASGVVKTAFTLPQIENMLLDKMKISGSIALSNFDVLYDSIYMKSDQAQVDFSLPNPNKSNKYSPFLYTKINSKSIEAGIIDSYRAFIKNTQLSLETSDVMDSTRLPDIVCTFTLDSLAASMDTIIVALTKPGGKFTMLSEKGPNKKDQIKLDYQHLRVDSKVGTGSIKMNKTSVKADILSFLGEPKIDLNYSSNDLNIQMEGNSVLVDKIQLSTNVVNDTTQKDTLLQWIPKGSLSLDNGVISTTALNKTLEIPSIKMDFSPELLNIKDSRLKIDQSDFSLSGTLTNMLSYYKNDSLLKGSFNFVSDQTDVLQLMSLTSGIGNDSIETNSASIVDSTASTGPYMVPKGIDVTLKTTINKALFGTEIAKDISGEVRVKDGLLVLNDLIFTTPASKMQLTAMYRTPRKNHIYAGFDYHMLDIEIESLLKMIPDLDSIMPMLKSFKGSGEFHIAAETYLDSMYNPKKSTIRAVSSIKGQDLVLLDGETFTEIAKKLRFNKKTENKVDSLSAEFTIFRQEIDIYPFMIVMDKYKAVIDGRHNMDMSFDYSISIVDSPLPMKLCLEVKGTIDDLKYIPKFKCKYDNLYRPVARMVVQNRQLEFRRMIREALVQKVKKK